MYKIVTDGSCDLSVERVKELEIKVVPFYVSIMVLIIKKKL